METAGGAPEDPLWSLCDRAMNRVTVAAALDELARGNDATAAMFAESLVHRYSVACWILGRVVEKGWWPWGKPIPASVVFDLLLARVDGSDRQLFWGLMAKRVFGDCAEGGA